MWKLIKHYSRLYLEITRKLRDTEARIMRDVEFSLWMQKFFESRLELLPPSGFVLLLLLCESEQTYIIFKINIF